MLMTGPKTVKKRCLPVLFDHGMPAPRAHRLPSQHDSSLCRDACACDERFAVNPMTPDRADIAVTAARIPAAAVITLEVVVIVHVAVAVQLFHEQDRLFGGPSRLSETVDRAGDGLEDSHAVLQKGLPRLLGIGVQQR